MSSFSLWKFLLDLAICVASGFAGGYAVAAVADLVRRRPARPGDLMIKRGDAAVVVAQSLRLHGFGASFDVDAAGGPRLTLVHPMFATMTPALCDSVSRPYAEIFGKLFMIPLVVVSCCSPLPDVPAAVDDEDASDD